MPTPNLRPMPVHTQHLSRANSLLQKKFVAPCYFRRHIRLLLKDCRVNCCREFFMKQVAHHLSQYLEGGTDINKKTCPCCLK